MKKLCSHLLYRYFFLFITEGRASGTDVLPGAQENNMDANCAHASPLESLELQGRYLFSDPASGEVPWSWPQPHPFTSLWASLFGAGSPNQVFSLIFPYTSGPEVISQTSMLSSLPSLFLLTLGPAQTPHSLCC